MTKRFGQFILFGLTSLLFVQLATAQTARLQVIHNSADIDARQVDVWVNGEAFLSDFEFRTATAFMDVPAGTPLEILIVATAINDTSGPFSVTLNEGESYVAVANGITQTNINEGRYSNPFGRDISLQLYVIPMAREVGSAPPLADIIAFHGSTDTPPVDVIVQGTSTRLVDDRDYGQIGEYASVPPLQFILDVTPADDSTTVLGTFLADLTALSGGAGVVFASGFATPSQNQGAQALGILGALPDGTVIELENLTQGEPGPWQFMGLSGYEFVDVFADTIVNGGHGIAVDRNNRVWIGNFFDAALWVLNEDGTNVDAFSPIASGTVGDVTLDFNNCRGMATDLDGNILFANSGGNLMRIDPDSGLGLDYYVNPSGGSPLGPAVDNEGFIYLGLVVGNTPVQVVDPSTFIAGDEIVLEGAPGFGRGLFVSGDGTTIMPSDLGESGGPVYIYTTEDFITYSLTDSIFNNTEGELVCKTQRVTHDRGPDGRAWISVDNSYVVGSPSDNVNNQFVIVDLETKEYEVLPMPSNAELDTLGNGPRGVAFSVTGDTAYAISWNANKVFRFVKTETGVAGRPGSLPPSDFGLGQNYPNPFNPTTTIPFTMLKGDKVELKVYDNLGRFVKTLVNKRFAPGRHEVKFDATGFASGLYYYQIKVGKEKRTREMMLVK